ncbi:NAD(P)-dependent oxidoreductase [soil metagenome]
MPTVGVVSLGAMGSAVADALARGGARVVATLEGRSERTARLVERAASVLLLPDLGSVVREAEAVLSIVPPERASAAAHAVLRAAREQAAYPLLVELNAIAPATAVRIESAASEAEVETVDGSISGPPPWKPGTTRVYLSGPRASEVAALPFEGVERIVVGEEVGTASAVKMSTASVYKGTTALLFQALLTAHDNGVLTHVLADLRAAAPELVANVQRRLASGAAKSGRYVGEMHEISATQSAAGLNPALFEAMAEIYASLATTPAATRTPEEIATGETLEQLLEAMREG